MRKDNNFMMEKYSVFLKILEEQKMDGEGGYRKEAKKGSILSLVKTPLW